jgi:hypothetical protein
LAIIQQNPKSTVTDIFSKKGLKERQVYKHTAVAHNLLDSLRRKAERESEKGCDFARVDELVQDTFFVKCLVLSDNLFIFAPSKSVKNQKNYGKDEENNSSGRDGSDELHDGCWAGECV